MNAAAAPKSFNPTEAVKTKEEVKGQVKDKVDEEEDQVAELQMICFLLDPQTHTNTMREFEIIHNLIKRYFIFRNHQDQLRKMRSVLHTWLKMQMSVQWNEIVRSCRRETKEDYFNMKFLTVKPSFRKSFVYKLFEICTIVQSTMIIFYDYLLSLLDKRVPQPYEIQGMYSRLEFGSDKFLTKMNAKRVMELAGVQFT